MDYGVVDTAVNGALVRRARRAGALLVTVALLAACGGSGTSTPKTSPTPTPTPDTNAAFECPSTAPAYVARRGGTRLGADATRFLAVKHHAAAATGAFTRLAITYDRGSARVPAAGLLTAHESAAGARYVAQLDLPRINQVVRVITVPSNNAVSAQAALRAQAGVRSVAITGGRRYADSVTAPYFTDDPYFQGFTAAQNETAGNPAPATFHVLPYVESAAVPGQWDMHAISLANAFAYSQPNNGSGIVNAFALGSSAVHIAIIDTGEDPTHPELASKIARQRCYITSPDGVQSKGNFSTDELGHGTNVTGIAAADTGNALGFTGAGGDVMIDAYRVFPTPDDNCTNESSDPQCGTDTADVASAITDAVAAGANVISMSLGGPSCTTAGVDPDPVEGAAVANAIASNVIVVAASGNGAPGTAGISAPACDAGVIAVGATSLDDGQPNGTGSYGGTAAAPVEYVAGYSQFGAPAAAPKSPSAWGIVAPGGDPASTSDSDNLHWIQNIWTSTPYMSSPTDDSFTGQCNDDYPNDNGTTAPVNCRTLIEGTSQATPHVAGVAALVLSVAGSKYATPAAMKTLLCETADDIGVNKNEGCGRLNAYRAMATALGDPALP